MSVASISVPEFPSPDSGVRSGTTHPPERRSRGEPNALLSDAVSRDGPDAPEPLDEDLARRARAGDEEAARLLFDRHLPTLRAAARARLPDALRGKVGASDVVQEAWLAAFVALGDFEDAGDGSFRRWLRKIVERKVSDEVRRHARVQKRSAKREVRFATEAARLEPDPLQPTPSQVAGDAEESGALRAVVDGLAADHAMVIRLVHQEGLTLVEAGLRMGRSPDATRMLYGRAMHRLAGRLATTGRETGPAGRRQCTVSRRSRGSFP
jgi:RNA polymerase sigma-70 factor, ECF subfamily